MDKTTIYEMLGFLLAFLGIGIAYYAVHFGIRLERTKRELEHKERMRALELGRSLPGDGSWLSPLRAGLLIARGRTHWRLRPRRCWPAWLWVMRKRIWMMAGTVSFFAVVCGTVRHQPRLRPAASRPSTRRGLGRPKSRSKTMPMTSSRRGGEVPALLTKLLAERKGKAMDAELIIPLAGIMMPLVLVPSIILLVHRQKRREWHHQERLRAIEMGLPASSTRSGAGRRDRGRDRSGCSHRLGARRPG